MKSYNYHTFDKGYEQLQRGTLHAVITDRNHLQSKWKQNIHCNIQIVDVVYKLVSAFALKKGSNWKEVISTLIHKYKSFGTLDHIRKKYRAPHCKQQTTVRPNQFIYEWSLHLTCDGDCFQSTFLCFRTFNKCICEEVLQQ